MRAQNKKIYLELNNVIIDSTLSLQNKFTFNGKIDIPRFASIKIEKNQFGFILENSEITIYGDIDSLWKSKLTGSDLTNNWNDYEEKYTNPIRNKAIKNTILANELLSKGDSANANWLFDENGRLVKEGYDLNKAYISDNTNLFGLFLLNNTKHTFSANEINYVLKYNYIKYSENSLYKNIFQYIENENRIIPGKVIPDFSFKDTLGITHRTSDFRGQYVFINFWASWCGICRKETPSLKKLYTTFHQKNFEIIGISIDIDKAKWISALKKDSPNWIDTIDGNGTDKISELLNIYAVPANFLIDPNGVIIGKDLRDENLEKALLNIFR